MDKRVYPPNNTLPFVCDLMWQLEEAGLRTWLFGGWAEEVWQLSPPRAHYDIDLLYVASDFQQLDAWMSQRGEFEPVVGKCFYHKRAFVYQGVLVEIFLLESSGNSYITKYFGDKYVLKWPEGTLSEVQLADDARITLASPEALRCYRAQHERVSGAYEMYIKEQITTL